MCFFEGRASCATLEIRHQRITTLGSTGIKIRTRVTWGCMSFFGWGASFFWAYRYVGELLFVVWGVVERVKKRRLESLRFCLGERCWLLLR